MNSDAKADPWRTWQDANPTHIREFQDRSSIVYYDNGQVLLGYTPRSVFDPRVPEAYLYYWQVMMNRPDITTWEQIREAERAEKDE
jgi:hypothetical protein